MSYSVLYRLKLDVEFVAVRTRVYGLLRCADPCAGNLVALLLQIKAECSAFGYLHLGRIPPTRILRRGVKYNYKDKFVLSYRLKLGYEYANLKRSQRLPENE